MKITNCQLTIAGWLVHMLTATSAILGIFSLMAIQQYQYILAFKLLTVAFVIDGIDGFLARKADVSHNIPKIDGALLDNIVDFFTYVLIPVYLLLVNEMIPPAWNIFVVSLIIFSAAYQFCQKDAKTTDNFFKGFPSYWNFAVFYMYILQTGPIFNLTALISLVALVFIPIKYLYPSRLTHFTKNKVTILVFVIATILFAINMLVILFMLPQTNNLLIALSLCYVIYYFALSIYRTIKPLTNK